jgi:hypothetical protein
MGLPRFALILSTTVQLMKLTATKAVKRAKTIRIQINTGSLRRNQGVQRSLHQTSKSRETQPHGLAKVCFDIEHNGAFANDPNVYFADSIEDLSFA